MSTNSCKCPTPPGGIVRCDPKQLAICSVRAGQIEASCVTPPTYARGLRLQNWVLSVVMNERRNPLQELTSHDMKVLESQSFSCPSENLEVKFMMPKV